MVFFKTEKDTRLRGPDPLVLYPFLKTLYITEFASSVHKTWGSNASVVLNINPHSKIDGMSVDHIPNHVYDLLSKFQEKQNPNSCISSC